MTEITEIKERGLGAVSRLVKMILAYISGKIVQKELSRLKTSIKDITIFENKDPQLPRMGNLTIFCENNSDISFEINRIVAEISVSGERIPNRGRLKSYPVARFTEDKKTIEKRNIGYAYASSTKLRPRRKGMDYCTNMVIEYEIPSWLKEISHIYTRGYLELQKEVAKVFDLHSNKIEYH